MASNSAEVSLRETGFRENGRGATTAATRVNQIAPTQVDAADLYHSRPASTCACSLSKLLFIAHLFAISILIAFLSVSGFLTRRPAFKPRHWYLPLLSSAAASVVIALLWLLLVLRRPAKALKASLWVSPLLACAVAVLLLADGSAYGLAFAVPYLVLAVIQSLYACWITRRLSHAYEILSASISAAPLSFARARYVALALVAGLVFFSFWTLGTGGIAATRRGSRFGPLYLLLLLLSLGWTMEAIRYTVLVAVSQIAYLRLTCGMEVPAALAFEAAANRTLGDVFFGAAVVPMVVAARGMARAMGVVAGGSDEFLFSCSSCYMGVADQLVTRGNRWGFIYAGVYGKGLGRASAEVWEMFAKQDMVRLIDLDITGSFCFFCGVASGGVSAIVAGSWAIATGKAHVTEITLYGFIIGYFMMRIGMAWPQACVAAYHVVFAENPQNDQIGSCISARMRELQSPLYALRDTAVS